MNNSQVAALVQNILMVGGSLAVATGKVQAPDVQSILGGLSTFIGFFWNHYSALSHPVATSAR